MNDLDMSTLQDARILIVDDQPQNVALLQKLLRKVGGYTNLVTTSNPFEAVTLVETEEPDLLLLDLMMPELDGYQVLAKLREMIAPSEYFPVLVLTADTTDEAKQRALRAGAKDFLTKPFDHTEVLLRIHNLLETRALHCQLTAHNHQLDTLVQQRTAKLKEAQEAAEQAQEEMLIRLARAGEFRDDDTGQHTFRVGQAAARTARELGLPSAQCGLIEQAARLHDLGKIGVSDTILRKPGKLTDEEFEKIKTHPRIGAEILSGGRSSLVQMAERIALAHHERWDGRGYPCALAGQAIPIEARIVTVVDVFDALTNDRPYKDAWSIPDALAELRAKAGKQFDPQVVEAFITTTLASHQSATAPVERAAFGHTGRAPAERSSAG